MILISIIFILSISAVVFAVITSSLLRIKKLKSVHEYKKKKVIFA